MLRMILKMNLSYRVVLSNIKEKKCAMEEPVNHCLYLSGKKKEASGLQ
jgi:hypothetical protein